MHKTQVTTQNIHKATRTSTLGEMSAKQNQYETFKMQDYSSIRNLLTSLQRVQSIPFYIMAKNWKQVSIIGKSSKNTAMKTNEFYL